MKEPNIDDAMVSPRGPEPSRPVADVPALSSQLERIRGVLRIADFRWLWISLAFSSLGDWLGLLAKTAMATTLATGYTAANFALGGVLVSQLLPAVLLGPFAGVFADRFDRRYTMVFCDIVRFGLFVTIPIVHTLTWLFAASFLIECFGVFWRPAKEASVPNLLKRKDQLESANQLSLITTYGITPVAAAILFAFLAWLTRLLAGSVGFFRTDQTDLAMYINAVTFLVAAYTVARIKRIGGRPVGDGEHGRPPSVVTLARDGWRFVSGTRLVRGLVIGILGAFAAGGTVIGTGKIYAASLGGGNAAYGVLFGAIFVGLGMGMALGPKIARDLSRRRVFGIAIVLSGGFLAVTAVMPHIVLAVATIFGVGFFAGIAYLAGMTIIGSEVEDAMRGRTFAFVQSMVQVVLLATLAAVPFLVGLVHQQQFSIGGTHATIDGSRFLLFAGGLVAIAVGIVAYRQMDDRCSAPIVADVMSALRRDTTTRRRLDAGGIFIAFEGGEGAGKSTQVVLLGRWLRDHGLVVTETHEPGATELGRKVRGLLLDSPSGALSPRAEALLFAADRAHHVDTVIRPALERGDVVLTDRYVDSSLAYQGGGRHLPAEEMRRLSTWATGELRPDLTVLLDIDPAVGLQRAGRAGAADRLERESLDFHRRVRAAFRSLAEANPGRYLVIDAEADSADVAATIRGAVTALIHSPGPPEGSGAQLPASEPGVVPARAIADPPEPAV